MSTTTLTDRYVLAVSRGLPVGQRSDVELELRTAIADAIDARVAAGEAESDAERAVLAGMGDPTTLAATFAERPRFLIGPELFPVWRQLLVTLLAIVVPIVTVLGAIAGGIDNHDIGDIIGGAWVAALMTTVQVAFWTTLVFGILEWTGAEPAELLKRKRFLPWTVDLLPESPHRRIRLGESVGSIVTYLIFAGYIVWQQVWPFIPGRGSERLPSLDPDLWSFWLPALLVVLAIGVGLEWVKYRIGRWTWPLAIANVAVNALIMLPIAVLAWRAELVNPDIFVALEWPEGGEPGSVVAVVIAVSAVGIALYDSGEGIHRAWQTDRSPVPVLVV